MKIISDMDDEDQRLKQAINLIIAAGYQVDAKALEFLRNLAQQIEFNGYIEKTIEDLEQLSEKPLFLTKDILEARLIKTKSFEEVTKTRNDGFGSTFKPFAKEVMGQVEILDNSTESINFECSVEDHQKHFQDRFTKIVRILRERSDVKEAVPISKVLKAPLNSRIKTVGLVIEKRERKRSVFIKIEDLESSLNVLIPFSSDKTLLDKSRRVLTDQGICVEVVKVKDDLFIAKDLIMPDIPERKGNRAHDPVCAVFTSDLHVGSNKFLNVVFDRFIRWLNGGQGSKHQREIASRVKYLIIAGDVVDGIGVYPGQEKEIVIDDIYEQYDVASKLIEKIPEYIEIIIIPGNHDAARQALPQPTILRKYAKRFYNLENVSMLSDPTKVRLHGVDLLIYHGRSLDDIISTVPDVTYLNLRKEITVAMRYFLKTRHLAPIYGLRTPIVPLPVDNLVIDKSPDILHTGHVHVTGYEMYRGTYLINSGTWQGQTEFQEKMGLLPTPGIVPILDLKNFNLTPINFLA